MRRCAVCGVQAWHRIVVEPQMIPVCEKRECRRFAAELAVSYCHGRQDDGRLCGAEPASFVQEEGQQLCGRHMRQLLQAMGSSAGQMLVEVG
jgi:hypothetical protein